MQGWADTSGNFAAMSSLIVFVHPALFFPGSLLGDPSPKSEFNGNSDAPIRTDYSRDIFRWMARRIWVLAPPGGESFLIAGLIFISNRRRAARLTVFWLWKRPGSPTKLSPATCLWKSSAPPTLS